MSKRIGFWEHWTYKFAGAPLVRIIWFFQQTLYCSLCDKKRNPEDSDRRTWTPEPIFFNLSANPRNASNPHRRRDRKFKIVTIEKLFSQWKENESHLSTRMDYTINRSIRRASKENMMIFSFTLYTKMHCFARKQTRKIMKSYKCFCFDNVVMCESCFHGLCRWWERNISAQKFW